MHYFSAGAMAFNDGANIWSDGVEVDDVSHASIMTDLSNGYTLAVDENGYPYTIEPLVHSAPPAIEDVFSVALAKLNNDFEHSVLYLKATYPLSEAITWPVQLAEAKALTQWLADNPTLTINDLPYELAPFLTVLSQTRDEVGVTGGLEYLAQRVLENDLLFTPALANVTGIRHGIEKQMLVARAANDHEALKAITWTFPYPPVVIE